MDRVLKDMIKITARTSFNVLAAVDTAYPYLYTITHRVIRNSAHIPQPAVV